MTATQRVFKTLGFSCLCGLVLTACSHSVPAPVVNLSTYTSYSSNSDFNADIEQDLPEFHEVRVGETLYSIAWRYGVDFKELAQQNQISDSFHIYPGQKLYFAPQQVAVQQQDFDPDRLQASVRKALGLAPVKQKLASPSKHTTLSASKHSRQKSTKKVTHQQRSTTRSEIARQAPSKSVNSQPKLSKIHRWQWPLRGRIVDRFSSELHGNKGLDISGKPGQSVRAAAPGRVVYRGNALKGYGNLVIVKHNDNFLSAYAHNSRIHVQENEIVKAGQIIADIGTDGTDKTKLHFEIRYRGKPVDPMKYLPKI